MTNGDSNRSRFGYRDVSDLVFPTCVLTHREMLDYTPWDYNAFLTGHLKAYMADAVMPFMNDLEQGPS